MRLWPQSLLWRTVLLLAGLIIVSQLAWFGMVRWLEREPRAKQIAQQATSVVELTRAALINVYPTRRRFFMLQLHQRQGIRIYPAFAGESLGRQPDRPFFKLVQSEIRKRLGEDTQVSFGRRGLPGLWVSFNIEDDIYWVAIPRIQIERTLPQQWIIWGLISLSLALLGAWLIARRISSHFKVLSQAAEQIGRGETPQPIPEQGPLEMRKLTQSFNTMNADLARLNQERSVMLAGISHDLRSPLTRLRLAVEMLDGKTDAATQTGMVQDIEDMDAIIGQFLAFVRGVEGELSVATDLNAMIQPLCDRYARSGKHIHTELQALPMLNLRPMAMQRLLGNLIDNAYMHGSAEVMVRTRQQGAHVCLSVLDRGPGIAPDQVALATQPFFRLNQARSGQAGAGLGLAIVEHIAQMHQGKLDLLSRVGGGLEARVTLPLATGFIHPAPPQT